MFKSNQIIENLTDLELEQSLSRSINKLKVIKVFRWILLPLTIIFWILVIRELSEGTRLADNSLILLLASGTGFAVILLNFREAQILVLKEFLKRKGIEV